MGLMSPAVMPVRPMGGPRAMRGCKAGPGMMGGGAQQGGGKPMALGQILDLTSKFINVVETCSKLFGN